MTITAETAATTGPARLHLSENPYGASPRARAAAAASLDQLSVYPDPARSTLISAIADRYRLGEDQVAVANGSDELVLLSSLSVGDPGRPGLTTAGTFPGYRICLESVRRGCVETPLAGTAPDVDRVVERMAEVGVVYLCNPHNPSGSALSRSDLDRLVAAAERLDVPLILDEAYAEFAPRDAPQALDYLSGDAPVLALRTFSKAYGLAALRIGYALGAARIVGALRRVQDTMPFSANRAGQAAALAALADPDHLTEVRQRNELRRAWFTGELDQRGRRHLPSVTNFVAVRVGDSATVERRLAEEHDILVRDAGRFGLPGYLRVSLGPPDALRRLLDALDVLDVLDCALDLPDPEGDLS